jgi:hypothetical protein
MIIFGFVGAKDLFSEILSRMKYKSKRDLRPFFPTLIPAAICQLIADYAKSWEGVATQTYTWLSDWVAFALNETQVVGQSAQDIFVYDLSNGASLRCNSGLDVRPIRIGKSCFILFNPVYNELS